MYDCDFIDARLQFINYNDFIERMGLIKKIYKRLTPKGIQFYKWYIYANVHMNRIYKDIIWDYLNGDKDDEYVLKMQKRYKPI